MSSKIQKPYSMCSNTDLNNEAHGKKSIHTVIQLHDVPVEKDLRTKTTIDLKIEYRSGIQILNSITEEKGLLSDDYRSF